MKSTTASTLSFQTLRQGKSKEKITVLAIAGLCIETTRAFSFLEHRWFGCRERDVGGRDASVTVPPPIKGPLLLMATLESLPGADVRSRSGLLLRSDDDPVDNVAEPLIKSSDGGSAEVPTKYRSQSIIVERPNCC